MITVSNPFSTIPPLFSDLAKILAGEIDCTSQILEKYSTDGSPYMVRPQAVMYPKNGTDLKHILSFAREYTMPVVVRGSGSTRMGGSLSEGIVVDLTRYFDRIRHINMLDQTISVDAGVSIKALRERLHGWNVDIPVLTAQHNNGTVGALVATKGVTATSFHFGTIREWVEGLTIVVDTGEEHHISDGITPSGRLLGIYQAVFPLLTAHGPILRANKPESSDDATGYSIWNTSIGPRQLLDQLVGGEGTLGIITSITFRLIPKRPHVITLCIPIKDKKDLLVYSDVARHHKAEHIFMYDSTFMELTDRYHLNRIPQFPDAHYALLISFSGDNTEKLHEAVRNFTRTIKNDENILVQYEDSPFLDRVTDKAFLFSLLTSYTQGAYVPIVSGSGIVVPLNQYVRTLQDLEDYLYSTGKLYVVTGNVASGHISVITLFDSQSKNYDSDLEIYTQTIFGIVKKNKGGISGEGGEGLAKTPYVPFLYNEATFDVFKKIKDAWDPLHILNPGKKISITKQYLKEHILRMHSI
jgi:FAD/FMN-containing dehydrogenase